MKDTYFQFENLKADKNICHLFTKKPFNFNNKLVSEEDIQNQYDDIQEILKYKLKKIVKPIQTHTNVVKTVTQENLHENFNNVDGLITNLRDIALVTSLADCQGIILYDSINQVIGCVHSGWKGTLNKIIENAIKIMLEQYSCNPKNIKAYICPSILKCCFEVDKDVKEKFEKEFNQYIEYNSNKNKYFIDTVAVNKHIMIKNGLLSNNIFEANICTKCNSDSIHSFRAEGDRSGRNIALVALKDVF